MVLIIFTIVLSISYGTRLITNYNQFNELIKEDEMILINPFLLKDTNNLELIEKRGFMELYKTTEEIYYKDVVNLKNNEGLMNEALIWRKQCDFFKSKHKVKVYSTEIPLNSSYGNLISNIKIIYPTKESYLLEFESSNCIKNYNTILANFLKSEDIDKFIISD